MATALRSIQHATLGRDVRLPVSYGWLFMLLLCLSACSRSDTGSKKRLTIDVGQIKEISIPSRGDETLELIGTSDNQEVADVSRQQLAPAIDTLKRANNGPTVFQIKGVTVGTATVVFSIKPMNQSGQGQPIRTYIVQVKSK